MRIVIFGTLPAMVFKFHAPLVAALVKGGHEVHLAATALTGDGDYAPRLRALGAQLHDVRVRRTGLNPIADLVTFVGILALLRAVRPDALLAYTAKPVIYGTMAAWVARVERRIALIVGLGYGFTDTAQRSLKRRFVRGAVAALYRPALARATQLIFQNRDDLQIFARQGLVGPKVGKTVIDGCGVDVDVFHQLALPDEAVFLFVGRLLVDKGVREFVAAARLLKRSHPGARFLLLGDLDENPTGIGRAEVESWVADGVVEWLGFRDDIGEVMAQASVFVLPSYREGLPQSGIEALASGRPVITTDVPGCREIVVANENGFLVPVRDADALAEAMRALATDSPRRARMGQASRRLAERRFAAPGITASVIAILTGESIAR